MPETINLANILRHTPNLHLPLPRDGSTPWGAEARNLFDLLDASWPVATNAGLGWVNVFAAPYSAIGDGTTDDTAALTAAALAATGGVLYSPPGKVYRITGPIVLYTGTTLDFSGSEIKIDSTFPTSSRPISNFTQGAFTDQNITLRNLVVNGNGYKQDDATQTTITAMLSFRRVTGLRFARLIVKNYGYVGIACNACRNVEICNNELTDLGYAGVGASSNRGEAIWINTTVNGEYSENARIHDNYIHDNNWSGIQFAPRNGAVTQNIILNSKEAGIYLPDALAALTYLESRDITISSNVIEGVVMSDVSAHGIECHAVGFTIAGNRVNTCQKSGIMLQCAQHGTVSGNTVSNCSRLSSGTSGAITINSTAARRPAKNLTIAGNTIYDDQGSPTTGYAIVATGDDQAENCTITGNNTSAGTFVTSVLQLTDVAWNFATCTIEGNTKQVFINTAATVQLTVNSQVELLNATSNNILCTLPLANSYGSNRTSALILHRNDTSANTVTIQRQGGDNINGGTSFALGPRETAVMVCDSSTTWRVGLMPRVNTDGEIVFSERVGIGNTNPQNALLYIGSGTGVLNDSAVSGITAKIDSTISTLPSAARFNLNLPNGQAANGVIIGAISQLEVNDPTSTGDAVALWGSAFANVASPRNIWGLHVQTTIDDTSAYTGVMHSAEIGFNNQIVGNINAGGNLHLGSGTGGDGYARYGLKQSGKARNSILLQDDANGPVDNALWFGALAAGNVPSGTPKFQVDSSGFLKAKQLNVNGDVSSTAWGANGIGLKGVANIYTDTSSVGVVTNSPVHALASATLAASSATTYTESSTLFIAGAPVSGTNVTQTTPRAFHIAGGGAKIVGTTVISGATSILGATSINVNNNNTTNIGTGSTTSAVNVGGASNAVNLSASGGTFGIYGATAVGIQTVTGSRGGNAALASLLTALAAFGFITDSSTA